TEHMDHGERYRRAREFFDVVTGLWDSFAEDAFVRDVEEGIYFDPDRMHVLDHKGEFLSVRGPLNIARPIQGWPVIVQAGASDAGRQLAAETAEMIFSPGGGGLAGAKEYYTDVRNRAAGYGRDPDHIKILPGCLVVVGDTVEEAQRKRALLDSLVHPDSGIASLSIALQMEEWLCSDACDGFNIMFPWVPGGLDEFVDSVVPELQRRGLFRREYEGKTLRENLGLPRPENRFFPQRAD